MRDAVWTFFYGSYINPDVLKQVDLVPDRTEVARLAGYDIWIRPLANLVRSESSLVYGIVATATHDELERLYAHAQNVLGGVYRPSAVVVELLDGGFRPALCYFAAEMDDAAPTDAYIGRIVAAAREFAFPDWYVERIERFRP